MKKQVCTLLLLLLGGAAVVSHAQGMNGNNSMKIPFPIDSVGSVLYQQRVSHFETLPIQPQDIVFLGNSLTSRCEWNEILQNPAIKNRGISGDTSSGVLLRIDNIVSGQPAKIFLMIGINDVASNVPVLNILANVGLIVNRIKELSPNTQIYIQSLLPVGPTFDPRLAANIPLINEGFKDIADEAGCTFINLYPHFLNPQGYLWPSLTNDDVHLMGNGYLLWATLVGPYVNKNFDPSVYTVPVLK
ncbi:MAG: sialate O-acetylesterase [Rikenella sp.]|nr:sialate O-acetylesterase [Rikenella sp.]